MAGINNNDLPFLIDFKDGSKKEITVNKLLFILEDALRSDKDHLLDVIESYLRKGNA